MCTLNLVGVRLRSLALLGLLGLGSASLFAQAVGEVEFARGAGFAQTPGQVPRALSKGQALREGDRLTTADGASAALGFTTVVVATGRRWSC